MRSPGSLKVSPDPSAIWLHRAWTWAIPPPALALAEQALQRFGRIDGLVHTVGTFAMADIDAADPAHWERCSRPI